MYITIQPDKANLIKLTSQGVKSQADKKGVWIQYILIKTNMSDLTCPNKDKFRLFFSKYHKKFYRMHRYYNTKEFSKNFKGSVWFKHHIPTPL